MSKLARRKNQRDSALEILTLSQARVLSSAKNLNWIHSRKPIVVVVSLATDN